MIYCLSFLSKSYTYFLSTFFHTNTYLILCRVNTTGDKFPICFLLKVFVCGCPHTHIHAYDVHVCALVLCADVCILVQVQCSEADLRSWSSPSASSEQIDLFVVHTASLRLAVQGTSSDSLFCILYFITEY